MLKIIVNDKKLIFNRKITKTLVSFLQSKNFNRTFSQKPKSVDSTRLIVKVRFQLLFDLNSSFF
jgi:hypothetical protein